MESEKTPNKALIGVIVVVLLAAATTAAVVLSGDGNNRQAISDNTPSPSTSVSFVVDSTNSVSEYNNGTYSADGSYQTPGGRQSIGVTITLDGDTITNATVEQHATSGESAEYQSAFLSGYKSQVVGKKISEISLDRVAGSSLTPNGFNNAVGDIKEQAAA